MNKSTPTPNEYQPFLKFVNDACIEKKKLKIRSFYLYHKCQLNCLKDLKNKESEYCMQSCSSELDKFYSFRKQQRPEYKLFHAIPQDLKEIQEMGWTQEVFLSEKKKIQDFRHKTQMYVESLKRHLDEWEKSYQK